MISFQKIGGKRNISITGDQHPKKWLILETLSKRRPLAFQIDDFLSSEECEYIKELALGLGELFFFKGIYSKRGSREASTRYSVNQFMACLYVRICSCIL